MPDASTHPDHEGRYRTIFNSIDEGVCVFEVLFDAAGRPYDYRFLETNATFEEQTGLRDAVGRTARELVPNLEDHWFEIYGRVALTGTAERFVSGSDAMNRLFDVFAFRLGGHDSRQVALLFKDITARRRAEKNIGFLGLISEHLVGLSRIDEVMATVGGLIGDHLQLSACAFVEVDETLGLGEIRHEWHRPGGRSFKGAYRLGDFLSPEFQDVLRAGELFGVDDTAQDPRTNTAEYAELGIGAFLAAPILSAGRLRFLLVLYKAQPHTWHEDERALTRELTTRIWTRVERARAEDALRESEARFRNLADHAPVAIWVTEPDGHCTYLNRRWFESTGQAPAAALGFGWLDAVHPDDREHVRREFLASNATGRPFSSEYRLRRRDGTYAWMLDSAAPRLDASGEFLGYVGSVVDIDERRAREAELQAASDMKDQFLAILSHELRTPLNAVVGWAHMLRTNTVHPDARDRALESLERNARAQMQLVDDLLDISRIISGKLPITPDAIELTSVLASAIDTIRPVAAAKGVALQFTHEGMSSVPAVGDAARLRQIVWNLLSNAVKFTPSGGRVDVELHASPTEARIVVQDTGEGIRPEFLPYVFERFRQGDATVTRRHGGLGLGLAIARHLAEAHGGHLAAHSEGPGRGARFTLTLPLGLAEAPPNH